MRSALWQKTTKKKQYVSDNAQLMAEWNYEKNKDIDPSLLTLGSNQKIWWKCKETHEWQASISNRKKGRGCPYCSNQKVLQGYNDLETINPTLAHEWNHERNGTLKPENFTANSGQKVWWKCSEGHEWQVSIYSRNSGSRCPICSNQKLLTGYNDLQTVNPSLAKEWNYVKNTNITPSDVAPNSKQIVWWKCQNGHEWQSTIANRNYGNGCPYCSGKKASKGVNDLQSINPTLANEWNYEKNGHLTPENSTAHSHHKVWWLCSKGHEWQATVNNRMKGRGCPYCSGRYPEKNINDLQTVNPSLAKEWNYERNNDLTPVDVLPNSNKKVWWKCSKGHEWQAEITSRNIGNGCPYCSGRKVLSGFNDLQTINPRLAKEWNYDKNGVLTPADVTLNSNKKVWWKCGKGHEWQAMVNNRNKGNGCPVCNSERSTSFPEYAIFYYLTKYGIEVMHSYKGNGYELDIYIPSQKIAIEYDGYHWHKDKTEHDLDKNRKCVKDGILLYRIREELPSLNDSSVDYIVQKNQQDLSKVLKEILGKIIKGDLVIDINRDFVAIENLREFSEKANSFLFSNPQTALEWNYEKNGNLKPENFKPNSTKKVWWICGNGHEWKASIAHRNNGRRCPYCSNKKVLPGYNDLQTINPHLAKEWNYEKNSDLKPSDFSPNSNKKVWWICSNGHEWQTSISHRNQGQGCPYCLNQKVLPGYNDLQTVNPQLAAEWNFDKNNGLTPQDVTVGSNKKVWWKCNKGHEWQVTISTRNRGNGCPYCAGQKVISGENDLQTINPILAKEWNHVKNNGLTPRDVMPYSEKNVWWKCGMGHEWQATVHKRSTGSKCPYCFPRKNNKA